MSDTPMLKLDWCSYAAAKYAVEHWHYSRRLSKARNVYLGVWESGQFVGVIVFGIGSGNVTNGERYGLRRAREVAELTRIALRGGAPHDSQSGSIRARILPLAKPYPKRPRAGSVENDAAADQADEGGVIPTPALHSSEVA